MIDFSDKNVYNIFYVKKIKGDVKYEKDKNNM